MSRIALCLISLSFLAACSTGPKQAVEPPPSYQPKPESTPVRIGIAPTPKLLEVQEAIKRVLKDAAVINTNYNPNFLTGDFNGDGSQDIAVIIKPVKLDEMNQELPPWLLRDPRGNKPSTVSLRIDKDEALLAVIHGYGIDDWRHPDATQTFLLKNVVGTDLHIETGQQFVKANSGKRLPRPQGDLIGETLQGTAGYLYYATANYAWYDPESFKDEAEQPRMVHRGKVLRAHAQLQKTLEVAFITAEELKTKVNANEPLTVIDVRSSEGYAASTTTIKGALHFKLRKLKTRLAFAPLRDLPKDREIVTYCACPLDASSIKAAQILHAGGFTRVKVLQGGWNEWLRASGPVQPK